MGRRYRTKTTVKEGLWFTINNLTHKYKTLKEGVHTLHSLTWSSRGIETGSIGYSINTIDPNDCFITLNYTITDKHTGEKQNIKYRIRLIKKPSNLPNNKGFRWYFECPVTRKLCTLLVCQNSYFSSRDPKKVYYESQTKSSKQRALEPGYFYKIDELEKEKQLFESSKFRKYYKGKPTKKYISFTKRYNKAFRACQLVCNELERVTLRLSKLS